jgi:hypothetical protein
MVSGGCVGEFALTRYRPYEGTSIVLFGGELPSESRVAMWIFLAMTTLTRHAYLIQHQIIHVSDYRAHFS